MDADRHGDAHPQLRVGQGPEEGGQALGKVVDADGQGSEQPHTQKTAALSRITAVQNRWPTLPTITAGGELLQSAGCIVHRQPAIDQGHADDADEEAEHGGGITEAGPQERHQHQPRLRQDLHQRYVHHGAGGEAQRQGEEAMAGRTRAQADQAADACGEPRQQCEPQGHGTAIEGLRWQQGDRPAGTGLDHHPAGSCCR